MIKRLLAVTVLASFLWLAGLAVAPQPALAGVDSRCNTSSWFLGFPTWYKNLDVTYDSATQSCDVNFDIKQDVPKVLLAIFEIVLRVGGLVAVGFVIYGGFQYILSQGEPENLKGARSTIINALIGLAIAISAVAIVNLIANNLT